MKMPDKCRNCPHTIVRFEEVHEGWCKYRIDCMQELAYLGGVVDGIEKCQEKMMKR